MPNRNLTSELTRDMKVPGYFLTILAAHLSRAFTTLPCPLAPAHLAFLSPHPLAPSTGFLLSYPILPHWSPAAWTTRPKLPRPCSSPAHLLYQSHLLVEASSQGSTPFPLHVCKQLLQVRVPASRGVQTTPFVRGSSHMA